MFLNSTVGFVYSEILRRDRCEPILMGLGSSPGRVTLCFASLRLTFLWDWLGFIPIIWPLLCFG